MYKYNIIYLLRKMSAVEENEALDILPKLTGVSTGTFRNWVYIKHDNPREIPQSALIKIANYFEVPFIELFNIEIYADENKRQPRAKANDQALRP